MYRIEPTDRDSEVQPLYVLVYQDDWEYVVDEATTYSVDNYCECQIVNILTSQVDMVLDCRPTIPSNN